MALLGIISDIVYGALKHYYHADGSQISFRNKTLKPKSGRKFYRVGFLISSKPTSYLLYKNI